MKVLQVIPFLSPKFGGSVTALFELSKELVKRNYKVTIITTDYHFDQQYANSLKSAGVHVILFQCTVNVGLFLYSPSMKGWLKNHLPDFNIVHLHNFRSYQNAIVRKYAVKYKIPYLLQAHGSVLPFFEKQKLKRSFDIVWGNKILRDAKKCIALTNTEKDQYIKMGVSEEKIIVIPNGLDLSQFSIFPEKGVFRKKYGIPNEEQIILFLGRIHKIKGLDLLIDAYALLSKDLSHTRLVIAGPDDGYLSTIQDQIKRFQLKQNPLITGPLFDRDKLAAYIDADVYVLPSYYEAFSNTVLEAWACGTPVIVTDSCAISPMVQHAGIVVKRDSVELASAIQKLLTDDSFRKICCDNGRLLVYNEFNIELVIKKIEECYNQSIQL